MVYAGDAAARAVVSGSTKTIQSRVWDHNDGERLQMSNYLKLEKRRPGISSIFNLVASFCEIRGSLNPALRTIS